MKLTKKLEGEILKAYNTIWDAYLRGDMRTFASILDENCYIIGSAAGEVFSNKKAAVKYYKSTAEQITGKVEFRNRKLIVMPAGNDFIVNEETDFYLLIDDQWTFYGPARISSLFHKKNNEWKLIHQHGSFPDSKTEEGEQVNADKIKAENIQLRDAVKRRTVELEQKNRELEIESSLEKVRAQALGMHKPDDLLNVCKVLFKELSLLGFSEIRNAIIHTFNDEQKYFIDYDYSDLTGGVITNIPYSDQPVVKRFLKQIRKSDEAFAEITVKGKELSEWKKFRKSGGQPDDPRLDKTSALYYYCHSVGTSDIGISTFSSINDEKLQLLKRFRNVFDLAYKRYTDIKQAEAQARESRIQLAMERVRARTMAMQKSDELPETSYLLFQQVKELGETTVQNSIGIVNEEAGFVELSTTVQGHHLPHTLNVPINDPYVMAKAVAAWKAKHKSLKLEFEGQELKNYNEHRNSFFETKVNFPEDHWIVNIIFFSKGWLSFSSDKNISGETLDLLKRFTAVFEQTYTRFNDLKQAEAQAREAQIEVALERVRARAMAMHSSQELKDVALELRNQMGTMAQPELEVCAIQLYEESPDYFEAWGAVRPPGDEGKIIQVQVQFPKRGIKIVDEMFQQYESGVQDYVLVNEGEKVPEWLNVLKERVPEGYKMVIQSLQGRRPEDTRAYWSMADFKGGSLVMTTYIPPSDDARKLLRRFANVFGLAYRRFIDLKNAEIQKREAQIELALERIRARTMAMHKSEELAETAQVLFQQLSELGGFPDRIAIGIPAETNGVVNFWTTDQQGSHLDHSFSARLNERTTIAKTYQAWKEQKKSLVIDLHGEELKEWIQFAREEMGIAVKDDQIKDRRVHTTAFFSHGWILVTSHEPQSAETIQILERFASVFNLTYRRFLDLKKAEAQANEARIEISLERIRSRALAMHKSDELIEVAKVVWEQMTLLGQRELESSVVHLYEADPGHIHSYRAVSINVVSNTTLTYGHMAIPKKSCEFVREWLAKFYSDLTEYTLELSGAKQEEWYELLFQLAPEVVNSMRQKGDIHQKRYYRFSKFSGGALLMVSKQEPSAEACYLQRRAAVVFDLAYRRFSDLQKAEAQARESQIEAALERVRSRSLAMHKSDELQEVVNTVFEKLQELSIDMDSCNIAIFKEGTRDYDYWVASPTQKRSASFYMPYVDLPPSRDLIVARESGADFSGVSYPFEIKNEWFEYAFKNTDFRFLSEDRKKFILGAPGIMVAIAFSKHTGVQVNRYYDKLLSEGEAEILKRFSKVFEQAYIRFLDLEKAEAQARESELELALERVRAKSMSMRHSDELADLVKIVFKELTRIGFSVNACIIMTYDERTNDSTWWISNFDDVSNPVGLFVPDHSNEPYLAYLNEWRKQTTKWRYKLGGVEKKKWDQYLFKNSGLATLPDEVKTAMQSAEEAYLNVCFNKYASITFGSFEPMSDKDFDTLHRFAKVFEQSYTRFLDLQKAEAQVRESQIETALERVRARTMGMHQSKELHDVIETITNQLLALSLKLDNSVFCRLHEDESWEMWMSTPEQSYPSVIHVPYLDHRIFNNLKEVKAKKIGFYTDVFDQEEARRFFKHFFENTIAINIPEERKQYVLSRSGMARSLFLTKDIWFVISRYSPDPFNDEENGILKRFAKVFEQSYIRFLDLQKAEAQAREAQIEASLERVRSKTMAMHNSNDVGDTVATMFTEFVTLGIHTNRCGILIFNDESSAEVWTARSNPEEKANLIIGRLNLEVHNLLSSAYKAWNDKQAFYRYDLSGDDLVNYYQAINNSKFYPTQFDVRTLPVKEFHSDFFFPEGAVFSFTAEPVGEEHSKIFKRFAGLFGQTYRRYLDLQRAEAQAREAQIEAALERVRAKAMAMHKSEDLNSAVATVFEELDKLDLGVLRCGISILDKEKRTGDLWVTSKTDQGSTVHVSGDESFDIHPLLQGAFEAWLKKEDFSYLLEGDDLVRYYKAVKAANFQLPESQTEFKQQYFYTTTYGAGGLFAVRETGFPEEAKTVMKRFAGVFDLTYKRFLDLQKAEANAREAQIEAGLERVRARTMAMHSSEDVSMATATMFTELEKLGIENLRGGITIIKPDQTQEVWSITNLPDGRTIRAIGVFDMRLHPLWRALFKAKENKGDYNYYWLAGKDKEDYIAILNETPNYLAQPIKEIPDVHVQSYFFGEGGVWTNSLQPHSEEDKQIMKRFTSVFSLTFRRYQDLKRAEAQAVEAQIEAGLERVRSRTMAMHKSDELAETAVVLFKQMIGLGIAPNRLYIAIINDNSGELEFWITDENGEKVSSRYMVNIHKNISIKKMYEGWTARKKTITIDMQGKELEDWLTYWKEEFHVAFKPGAAMKRRVQNIAYFSKGFIAIASPEDQPETTINLLERFAAVFNLTYTRFSDLQQAEAQAREATIEAALEKVRGKAIAMHNSNDLSVTVTMIISELRKLGITPIRCGVGIINKETHKGQLYTATTSAEGDSLSVVGWVLLQGHPVLENIYQKWVDGEDYFPELTGDSMRQYYEQLLAGLSVPLPDFKDEQKHYGHFFAVSVGCLYAWADVKYNDDEIKILKRFATIIDLTFRRYFELQKSEANAREAVKQAALDRVRADIASMRSVSDLERITPLIWNELTTLGIPFIRCGVFIMDEEPQLIHTFLSTPDGKAIAAFHLPYDTPGNLGNVISNWKVKRKYIDHWGEAEFIQFAEILVKQGALASAEQYLKTIPHGGFYLHFLPFLQGMLYVGNTTQLCEEEIELIQHVADAFSTAYARYEDFNKLEAAKQQVENTLTDLKQAQTQLVQSEKMASLGELTAGIAHEIQNPLNFVNNFSDVSNELLEEMKMELEKGNKEDAIAIVEDVKQNLEKILHHGKRADAIVKGMLQHSRTSSGQKEPTDINILADEYLRLAFHGLRAKDKSFNAKFETEFDSSIEKINIIPQDIGRVVLNLINNAFYAVTEKKKHVSAGSASNGYEPTVTVTTKKENGKIEIKVKDNGSGIPPKVLEKIFQPFFTTKPTGQGTGLGLSLAYDIVTKGHGGELKVETKEGEGSEFIIQLSAT